MSPSGSPSTCINRLCLHRTPSFKFEAHHGVRGHSARLSPIQPIDALRPLVLGLSSSSVHAQDAESPPPTSYLTTSWANYRPTPPRVPLSPLAHTVTRPSSSSPALLSPAPSGTQSLSPPQISPLSNLDLYSQPSCTRTRTPTWT